MRRIIAFTLITFIYFLANYYVFNHINILLSGFSLLITSISFILALFLSSSFILFFLFAKKIPVYPATILYKISTGWMIILVYSFLLFLLYDCIKYVNEQLLLIPENIVNSRYTVGVVIFIVGFICLYGFINYLNKRRVHLQLSTFKNLKKPVKIVMISDLHLGYAIRKRELKQWIKKINNEKPDILLIAGDIIDNSVLPLNYFELHKYFKEIKAPLGIYSCLGNHEYISGVTDSIDFIKRAGIHLLKDTSILIDNNFYIVGRDDRTNAGRQSLSELFKDLDKTKPIILLDHQPYHLNEAEENEADIQFSGHTHQGQIWPLSLIVDAIYEKSHGYLKKGNTHIYVSSGIGIWGGRYRIGTRSEYIVVELSKEDKNIKS